MKKKSIRKILNLKILNPQLAEEWHPTKNGDLTPRDVTPGSNKRAWWKCKNGHEWNAIIGNRNKGRGCPFCSGRNRTKENNLAVVNPELASEWHYAKNRNLNPYDLAQFSNKKVWWKCKKIKNHIWEAYISDRSNGSGCPFCSKRRASPEYNLEIINPDLAVEWHPTKNGRLTPRDVTPCSRKKVWWVCEKGHEFELAIFQRKQKQVCSYCIRKKASPEYNLAKMNPKLAKEWHPKLNGNVTPKDVTPRCRKKVWWRCNKNKNHKWQATVNKRSRGSNCPYCSRRYASPEYNLLVKNPKLATEWHPTKNGGLTPKDVTPGSRKKAWWKCKKKGHTWQAIINSRNQGNGCHKCANKSLKRFDFFEPRIVKGKNNTKYVLTYLKKFRPVKVREKFYMRKISTGYARYIYGIERIPDGYIIWHKDGDPLNNKIENLECISRSDAIKRTFSI